MVAEVPFLPALHLTVSRVHLKNNQQVRPDPQQALSLSPYIHTVLMTSMRQTLHILSDVETEARGHQVHGMERGCKAHGLICYRCQCPANSTGTDQRLEENPPIFMMLWWEGRQTVAAKSLLLSA